MGNGTGGHRNFSKILLIIGGITGYSQDCHDVILSAYLSGKGQWLTIRSNHRESSKSGYCHLGKNGCRTMISTMKNWEMVTAETNFHRSRRSVVRIASAGIPRHAHRIF